MWNIIINLQAVYIESISKQQLNQCKSLIDGFLNR